MDLENFNKILKDEPKYRIKQGKEAVFRTLISDWSEATFFSLELRKKLNELCPLSINAEKIVSKKGDSIKVKIFLKENYSVESALMHHGDGRNTVCVSSQVGCPLACKFCATGKMGFKRGLTAMEIIQQVIFFARLLKKEKKKITNVVFMGMGEPFLNYDNVMEAIRVMNDKNGLNIGARHISISTVGITEGIKNLAKEGLQINLAISLHAPSNELRSKIIPANNKYPIGPILRSVDEYIRKTKRKVMFEYLLIDGVNDSDSCALELAKIMKKPLYFLNLILYNPTGDFKPSSAKRLAFFRKILGREGIRFVQRYRFGQDIKSACGQLATNNGARSEKAN